MHPHSGPLTKTLSPCCTSARAPYAFSVDRRPWRSHRYASSAPVHQFCTCYTQSTAEHAEQSGASDAESQFTRERTSLSAFANNLRGKQTANNGSRLDAKDSQNGPMLERAFLVGVAPKGNRDRFAYNVHESLEELGRLAETAGLEVRSLATLCPRPQLHCLMTQCACVDKLFP